MTPQINPGDPGNLACRHCTRLRKFCPRYTDGADTCHLLTDAQKRHDAARLLAGWTDREHHAAIEAQAKHKARDQLDEPVHCSCEPPCVTRGHHWARRFAALEQLRDTHRDLVAA